MYDPQEASENGWDESSSESEAFDFVGEEQRKGLLVEAEFLFQDECVVERRRQIDDGGDEAECEDEEDGMCDFAAEELWEEGADETAGECPELGLDIEVVGCDELDLRVETVDEAELGFCASVCLLYEMS